MCRLANVIPNIVEPILDMTLERIQPRLTLSRPGVRLAGRLDRGPGTAEHQDEEDRQEPKQPGRYGMPLAASLLCHAFGVGVSGGGIHGESPVLMSAWLYRLTRFESERASQIRSCRPVDATNR